MSTNSNEPSKPKEVDLGQLFKLIGDAYDRFFNFFINIFKTIFLAFVWLIFLIKKRIFVLLSVATLGFLIGTIAPKFSPLKFESSAVVAQNYPTGENLYNLTEYYNNLVKQKDYEALGQALAIDTEKTKKILSFDVKPLFSGNDNIVAFNEFLLEIDTLASPPIVYKDFLENLEDHSYKYQKISIQSTLKSSFKLALSNIVKTISLNPHFVNEQKKDIIELTKTKTSFELALVKSDSIQSTYKRVLERELISNNASENGIIFEGSSKTKITREYELYLSDLQIREKLIEVERDLLDKQYIIETISNKRDSGLSSNTKNLFGAELPMSLYTAALFFLLVFAVLLALEFSRFIEKFRTQVSI